MERGSPGGLHARHGSHPISDAEFARFVGRDAGARDGFGPVVTDKSSSRSVAASRSARRHAPSRKIRGAAQGRIAMLCRSTIGALALKVAPLVAALSMVVGASRPARRSNTPIGRGNG